MNSKEIERLRATIPCYVGCYNDMSEEQKQLDKELSLREMIMSCLTYGTDIYNSHYTLDYKDKVGEERFYEILKEQETYFKEHCRVEYNVYTDNEGCTYNSCIEDE